MRIGGIQVTPPPEEVLVLPRGEGEPIVFRAKSIPGFDEFDAMVPEPTPPVLLTKEGKKNDYDDDNYKAALVRRNALKVAYFIIKSLEPSNIEWDTVDHQKPNSWLNWEGELRTAGLMGSEVSQVNDLAYTANGLNELKLKAAREAFLRGQQKE